MPALTWDADGERTFEYGVDRGVLYVGTQPGVVWNGLVSVTEKSDGGGINSYYIDGDKVTHIAESEDFAATINAFTYPDEFEVCDGTAYLGRGLSMASQTRQPFGLSYRTKIGDDVNPTSRGYKVHLIYNALVPPTSRDYASQGKSVDPLNMQWDIDTVPVKLRGRRPTAHFIVDTTRMDKYLLAKFETLIYGSDFEPARLPTPDELITFFNNGATLVITVNGDGTWTADGPDDVVQILGPTEFLIDWPTVVMVDEDTYTVSSD